MLEEINNLIAAGKVLVDGSEVPLQFVFGSDYKVIPDLVDVIVIVLTMCIIVFAVGNGYECCSFKSCLPVV